MSTTLRTLCVLALTCASAPVFAEGEGSPVQRLIGKLGSAQFLERQEASNALQTLGPPALEALRAAALSPDLEIRIRAQELVAQIERKVDTQRLLASPPATLSYTSTPFADACRDFEARTGFQIKLNEDAAVLSNRTVSLQAAGNRWHLLEQFCTAAGLVEVQTRATVDRPIIQARLGDGAPRLTVPTAYLGKVRVRALPPDGSGWGQAPGVVETTCQLEVSAETNPFWNGIPEVRVHRAIDEHGQSLEQGTADDANAADPNYRYRRGIGYVGVGDSLDTALRLPVRLRLASKPSQKLKELHGTLLGQVETAPEPLLTLDAIIKAANQTILGKDGSVLKIGEVSRDDQGLVKVAIDFQAPTPETPARGPNRAWMMKRALMDARGDSGHIPVFELRDQDGQAYEAARYNETTQRDLVRLAYSATLHFLPKDANAEPGRLTLSGRRVVTVEIPFTLKDVLLP